MTASSSVEVSPRPWPAIVRLLYTHNPFYLIGTFLVLFGLQQSLGREPGLATNGVLVGLLAAYALLLAGVAAIVIRLGKVWDDARTILLVIVLLFFMLSTSLDVHILYAPLAGTLLLAAGLVFSVLVSESVLRGLKIGLAPQYRGPYYLMLALLFGYPVALAWISKFAQYELLSWALFAFPAFAALALLTLLPAARTKRRREPATGTPWPWPFYPWSLFVYLTIGVSIRAWWLTIAFEPTEGQDTGFGLYFLAPLALAWGAIVVEIGRARHRQWVSAFGMLVPLIALAISFPGPAANPVAHQWLHHLAERIGSPAQLAIYALVCFYAWAWSRGRRGAEAFLLGIGGLAPFVGPGTLDTNTFVEPQPVIVALLVAGLAIQSLRRKSTWRALAAGGIVALGFTISAPLAGSHELYFWQMHAPILGGCWLLAIFNDELAKCGRELAWRATPVFAGVAALVYPFTLPLVPLPTIGTYAALLLLTSLALWYRDKRTAPLAAGLLTLAANLIAQLRQVYILLEQSLLAEGLPWLTWGLVVVALAFGISLLKMGLWQRAREWLTRMNVALGGAAPTG